jgi:MFS family permease
MLLITLHSIIYVVLASILVGLFWSTVYSTYPAWLAEQQDAKVRYSGVGIMFNFGAALGSFASYISTYLFATVGPIYGTAFAISLVGIIGAVIALVFTLFSRDRAGEPLD